VEDEDKIDTLLYDGFIRDDPTLVNVTKDATIIEHT
jgi:hypothetical protein